MFIDDFINGTYNGVDPFNKERERNHDNTDGRTYNCAGYALETFSWYLPVDDSADLDYIEWGSFDEIMRNGMSFAFVLQILRDFPDVHLIGGLNELDADEYAFAFRVGVDDFHFVKRGRNHQWYEKRGGNPRIYRMTEDEVFHSAWDDGRYNGPIFLFANKSSGIEEE